jgi:hypothetical protein
VEMGLFCGIWQGNGSFMMRKGCIENQVFSEILIFLNTILKRENLLK